MEHEMKISPSAVRRLLLKNGWSQEQLATASGLSLRTIQRIEASGNASLESALSLAATFEAQLVELQDDPVRPEVSKRAPNFRELLVGLAVLSTAGLLESARVPGLAQSDALGAFEIALAIAGLLLILPTVAQLRSWRASVGVSLAILGVPLLALLVTGAAFALVSGRSPAWQLAVMGAAGAALVVMAIRELRSLRLC